VNAKPPPVPRGAPLRMTDAQMEALAVPQPQDVVDAQAAWRRDAPAPLKRLLDAEPVD
jgi:hypothetical protein